MKEKREPVPRVGQGEIDVCPAKRLHDVRRVCILGRGRPQRFAQIGQRPGIHQNYRLIQIFHGVA